MAGWNEVKTVPVLPDFDSLGWNAYPRNVNEMQSYLRFRLLSPAVYDLGFVRMQPQPDILQPFSYGSCSSLVRHEAYCYIARKAGRDEEIISGSYA